MALEDLHSSQMCFGSACILKYNNNIYNKKKNADKKICQEVMKLTREKILYEEEEAELVVI